MVTTQSKTLNYKQGTFSFFKAFENQSITHNNNEFLKLGETGDLRYPILQNLYNGTIYYHNHYKLIFINSSWGQFIQTADEIQKFETEVQKICDDCEIAIQRIGDNLILDEQAFNEHVLPFLTPFPIQKYSYFDRFKHIAEKFTKNVAWKQEANYAHTAYLQWEKDGSLIKLLQNSHIVEHYLKCRVFNNKAQRNAEKIAVLLIKLKRKLHRIDKAAFENQDYFWPSSLFGSCVDLDVMFPDLENNPLSDFSLMDFTAVAKIKKIVEVAKMETEDDLPF